MDLIINKKQNFRLKMNTSKEDNSEKIQTFYRKKTGTEVTEEELGNTLL